MHRTAKAAGDACVKVDKAIGFWVLSPFVKGDTAKPKGI